MGHRENRLHKALTIVKFANIDPSRETVEALINAAILAGLTFFTTLAGIGAVGLLKEPTLGLLAAGISSGLAFFTRLAIERGLK